MKKTFFNYYLPNILFNVFEIGVIFMIGILFDVSIIDILIIFVSFILNKVIIGKSMHYKDWYLCLIWSTLLFISFYLLSKIDIKIAVVATSTYIFFSQKSNIKDLDRLFFWGGNTLNQAVFDWVKFNKDNKKLLEYEKHLKENDKRKYYIFVYRFKELKSYSEIARLMDIDAQRVSDEIKIMSHFIEYSIRLSSDEEGE
jgi:predicted DNA-binding protein YlxM (UPF0122 family)